MKELRRGLRGETGGTLVETAFSLSVLFLLIFGILEGSLAVYSYHYLSHVARQGSRYAMVRGATWGSNCTDYTYAGCTATEDEIKQYVKSLGFPGINSNDISINVSCSTSINGPFVEYGGASCNAFNDVVQVKVSYPFSLPIAGIVGSCPPNPTKFCMSTTSEMVIAN